MQNHFFSIAISGIITVFFSFFFNPAYDFAVYIWSYVSFAFILSVALRIFFLRKREDILFFTAIFLTWLNFLQPYLRSEKVTHLYRIIPEGFLFEMSFFSALGIIALYLGYYKSFSKKIINPIFNTNNRFNSKQLGRIMLGVMTIYLIYRGLGFIYYDLMQSLKGVLAILDYIPSLISAGLTLIILRKKGNKIIIILLFTFLILQFFIAVAQTLFIYVILLVFVPFLIYFFEKNKVPVISILIVTILLTPLFFLRHYYRKDVLKWWYGGESVTTEFLIERGFNILSETYEDPNFFNTSDKVIDSDKHTKSRFEQVSYMGQCVFQHEAKDRPFLLGETFWWLPVAPIPRVIFPFKPENKMGTDLAEDYGLKGQSKGTMNWPMLVEFYINFGFFGIIILSFFQGLAYKYTYSILAYGKGDLNLIALFSLILPIIKIESNITMIFGQVIQFLLIWLVLSLTVLKPYKYKPFLKQ